MSMVGSRSWKSRELRTDAEFRNFGNRILVYELVELINAQALMASLDFTNESCLRVRNALVESSAIHSRNIIEFLYFPRNRKGDVRAIDYGVDWTESWEIKVRGPLGALYRRASKQVQHVTAGRLGVRARDKRYNVRATRQLLRAFARFVHDAQRGPKRARIGRVLESTTDALHFG